MDKCTAPELIQEISANTTTSTTTKMPGEEVFIRLSHKTVSALLSFQVHLDIKSLMVSGLV